MRTVRIDNRRTKRSYLHPGIFFADHATLKTGVHGDQLGGVTKQLFVRCLQLYYNVAVRFGLPSWIIARMLDFESRQSKNRG